MSTSREESGFKHSSYTYRTINGVRWPCVTAGGGALLAEELRKSGIKYRLLKESDDVYCHPNDVAMAAELLESIFKIKGKSS